MIKQYIVYRCRAIEQTMLLRPVINWKELWAMPPPWLVNMTEKVRQMTDEELELNFLLWSKVVAQDMAALKMRREPKSNDREFKAQVCELCLIAKEVVRRVKEGESEIAPGLVSTKGGPGTTPG